MTMKRAATTNANAILAATVLVALVLAAPLARADPDASAPVVSTTAGKVQGEVIDGMRAFKGIPYAADTGGANRWAAPKDPEPWSDVRDATTFMDLCPQPDPTNDIFDEVFRIVTGTTKIFPKLILNLSISEDCLGLNVYTPSLDENLPVMVWIHGGSLMTGSGSMYPHEAIVEGNDVVLVSINYRLGFLGYFPHPELSEANFGLLDQVKALEWVRDNIGSFGGDPSRVTIVGESAGGASVLALMVSPLSEGLFQSVVSQSPAVMESPDLTAEEASILGVGVGERVGSPEGAGQLDGMREVPAGNYTDLMMKMSKYGQVINIYVTESMPLCLWYAFAEGRVHDANLIIGSTENENSIWHAMFPQDTTTYPNTTSKHRRKMRALYGPEDSETVLEIFPGKTNAEALTASIRIMSDTWFGAPSYYVASRNSELGRPTYLFLFTQGPVDEYEEGENITKQELGAFHGQFSPTERLLSARLRLCADDFHLIRFATSPGLDIFYLFDAPSPESNLARAMHLYWTNFAKSGDPNKGEDGSGGNENDLPEWKAFQSADPAWQILSEDKIGSEPVPEDTRTMYLIIADSQYPDVVPGSFRWLNG